MLNSLRTILSTTLFLSISVNLFAAENPPRVAGSVKTLVQAHNACANIGENWRLPTAMEFWTLAVTNRAIFSSPVEIVVFTDGSIQYTGPTPLGWVEGLGSLEYLDQTPDPLVKYSDQSRLWPIEYTTLTHVMSLLNDFAKDRIKNDDLESASAAIDINKKLKKNGIQVVCVYGK